MTVRRSIEEISGKLRAKEPKTGKGRRIDLPGFAVDALRTHRARMLAEGHIAGPVFCAEGGWLRKGNVYRRSFAPLIVKAKVPRIRFHDFRHTSATLLLLAGENVKVISTGSAMPVSKSLSTADGHVLPSMQKGAADRLQKLLG